MCGIFVRIVLVCVRVCASASAIAGDGFWARLAFSVSSVLIALLFADQIASLMAVVGLAATMCTSVLFPLLLQLYSVAVTRGCQLLLLAAIGSAAVLAVAGTIIIAVAPK